MWQDEYRAWGSNEKMHQPIYSSSRSPMLAPEPFSLIHPTVVMMVFSSSEILLLPRAESSIYRWTTKVHWELQCIYILRHHPLWQTSRLQQLYGRYLPDWSASWLAQWCRWNSCLPSADMKPVQIQTCQWGILQEDNLEGWALLVIADADIMVCLTPHKQ